MQVPLVPVDDTQIAITDDTGSWSWREFDNRTACLAASLAAELETGERVLASLENSRWFLLISFACSRAGLVFVPVSPHLTDDEVAYVISDARPSLVINVNRSVAGDARTLDIDAVDALSEVGLPAPQRPAGLTMLYTSGTTGRPKGVSRPVSPAVTPRMAAEHVAATARWFGYEEGGAHLVVCPLYHGAPHIHAAYAMSMGQRLVIHRRFDAERLLEAVATEQITSVHVVPTMLVRLLALPEATRRAYSTASLRLVVHGAAACAEPVKRGAIDWFGDGLVEYYGSSEGTGPSRVRGHEWLQRPGTVGQLHPSVHAVAVDEEGRDLPAGDRGVLYFRSAAGPAAYHGDPEKTANARRVDGSFTVGDVGYLDEDGYLFITGRVTDLVITGGVNVYPAEVESVLAEHPGVEEVAVIGVPDQEWGEAVHAVVVPRPGCVVELSGLREFASQRLAPAKLPRSLALRESMPLGATGKVDKASLARETALVQSS